MNTINIVFSADKTECTFFSEDKPVSGLIKSKSEAENWLAKRLQENRQEKGAIEKFLDLREEIVDSQLVLIEDGEQQGSSLIELREMISKALKQFEDFMTPSDVTLFDVCKNCGKHGVIKTKRGVITQNLETKNEAFSCLMVLKKDNHIDREEFDMLIKEIEKSSLRVL